MEDGYLGLFGDIARIAHFHTFQNRLLLHNFQVKSNVLINIASDHGFHVYTGNIKKQNNVTYAREDIDEMLEM